MHVASGFCQRLVSFKFLLKDSRRLLTYRREISRNNTEDATGLIDYPTAPDQFLQWIEGWLGGVINDDLLFRALPGHWQAAILCKPISLYPILSPSLGRYTDRTRSNCRHAWSTTEWSSECPNKDVLD